jgi:MFS family permease
VRRVFIAIAAGVALADASIVTLGLPSIRIDLDASVQLVAAVLGVYTAVLAVALLPAAWLCRRFGDAHIGFAGLALFGAASLGCGTSDSIGLLLALRAVQALGGAGLLVAAFELLDAGQPGAGRRMWVAASVFGIAVGPAIGGALTQAFDWRAIFLAQAPIVLPAMVVALLAARRESVVPDDGRDPDRPTGRMPLRDAAALALLSASLTAVIFLVVLLLVSGWSIRPLAAAAAVSVLPVAALLSSRTRGDPQIKAIAGCGLVAGGVGCLALLPGASAWWTVIPQVLAGAGMGMALPALSGELIPERTRHDVARLLAVRHAGIAVAVVALGFLISSNLNSTIDSAREQGTAAVLDAKLPPQDKISIAPDLFGSSLNTTDIRGELRRSVRNARSEVDSSDVPELERLGNQLDDVVTGAVRDAFRGSFIVASALALLAALILLSGSLVAVLAKPALATAAVASIAALAGYGIAFAAEGTKTVPIRDPCQDRDLPDTGGITGFLQDQSLAALDRAACEFHSSREELLLALFDDRLQKKFEEEHHVDPRDALSLGPALLGL